MSGTAAWARQTSLVESFGTAGRHAPGIAGENVRTIVAVGVVQKNKYGYKINRKDSSFKMDDIHDVWSDYTEQLR